jgi:hypothetical protein
VLLLQQDCSPAPAQLALQEWWPLLVAGSPPSELPTLQQQEPELLSSEPELAPL